MKTSISYLCLAWVVMFVSPNLLWSQADSQDSDVATPGEASSLETAKQISANTGRPIFAIAGRST